MLKTVRQNSRQTEEQRRRGCHCERSEAISVFGQRLLRSAAQKRTRHPRPGTRGRPSFRARPEAATRNPGAETLDSRLRGNDGSGGSLCVCPFVEGAALCGTRNDALTLCHAVEVLSHSPKPPPLPADLFTVGLRFLQNILLPVGCALMLPMVSVGWDGPDDNKPETELLEMDDPTLAWETQEPCVTASLTSLVVTKDTIAKRKAALRYLASIVAMKRKKDGQAPPWLYELAVQAEKGSSQGCRDIARNVYLLPVPPPGEQSEAPPQAQAQPPSGQEAAAEKK